jgi:hypothetical protein
MGNFLADFYKIKWPLNRAQQQAFIGNIEGRIANIQARRKSITVRSWTLPSQGDWEAAYFQSTGFPAPILPGTRLYWYDLSMGYVKSFTVALDVAGGNASTGTVVPYVDDTYTRPPFRLIAAFDSVNTDPTGSSDFGAKILPISIPSVGIGFFFNKAFYYGLANRGMQAMLLTYRLRMGTTINTDKLYLGFGNGVTILNNPDDGTDEDGSVWVEILNASNAVSTAQTYGGGSAASNSKFVGRAVNNNSPAYTYSHGVILVNSVVPQNKAGELINQNPMPIAIALGTRVDNAFSTGKIGWYMGASYRHNQMGAPASAMGFEFNVNYPGIAPLFGKVWAYGLFSKNTASLEEDILP